MNKVVSSKNLLDELRLIWPLPKYITSLNIKLEQNGMAKLNVECYVEDKEVVELIKTLINYDIVPNV